MIHYADELERYVADALTHANIKFIHESERVSQRLDFFLPDHNVYLEVKKFQSDRSNDQLKTADNVILIQGKESVNFFIKILYETI